MVVYGPIFMMKTGEPVESLSLYSPVNEKKIYEIHTLLMHGGLCSNIEFSSMLCTSFDMIVLVVSYFTLE